MKQKDKELLLKDLCARLPYKQQVLLEYKNSKGVVGTIININVYDINDIDDVQIILKNELLDAAHLVDIKPYLRPMSSMTKEEKAIYSNYRRVVRGLGLMFEYNIDSTVEWLLQHHFDYRGLIEKGLALEAPEEMYKN